MREDYFATASAGVCVFTKGDKRHEMRHDNLENYPDVYINEPGIAAKQTCVSHPKHDPEA